jgi:hypothetical protein
MKKSKCMLPVAICAVLVFFMQSAPATILTFDVQDGNFPSAYIGNELVIPSLYGSRVAEVTTLFGNYQTGNGLTPNIAIAYAPKGTSSLVTAGGGTAPTISAPLVNASFEAADLSPAVQRIAGWTADWNNGGYHNSPTNYHPRTGLQDAQMYYVAGMHSDAGVVMASGTTYTFTIWARGHDNYQTTVPPGETVLQLFSGEPFNGGTQLGTDTDFSAGNVTNVWQAYTTSYTATPGDAGGELWVRVSMGTPNGWMYYDDASLTYPANYGTWDKVAKLSWSKLSDAQWDFVFTPDRGYGVKLNSFMLEPVTGSTGHSGTWTLYQGSAGGPVLASGSWSGLGANQTVNVSATPVSGPVVLRLVVTAGPNGLLGVDNLNFDQVTLACDGGYQWSGDIVGDCIINFKDVAKAAMNWMGCNDLSNVACTVKTWPK